MRFARSLGPALLPITLVVAVVCVGETPLPAPREEQPAPLAAAFREQRLEWTDGHVSEVVVASPPWQQAIAEPVPVPTGNDGAPSAVLATGIPETAMASYTSAADNVAESDPSCGLAWSVIAAIGRVESNHGRYGGAQLHTDGSIRPVIRGIALDGRPGVAAIGDSDGGGLDGDRVFDRAIGPMQFIPSTWRNWAADGNGDDVRDPDNMFDATLAAGRYLCAGDIDTRTPEGLRAAIFRYNQSDDYVAAVVSIATAYRDNASPVIPNPAEPAPVEVVAQTPVVVTTPPPAPAGVAPSSAPPSTTESTKRPKPARPGVCTVAPGTTAVHPWMPEMPVVTCTPRPGSDSSDDEELPAQAGTSVVRPELEGGS